MGEASFDASLDDLMGTPLGEFTARRQALARALRQAGDREGADRLAEIRKPTVPLAAANQVARHDPEATEALLQAGASLAATQQAAMAGKGQGPDELRQATAAFHAALGHLVKRASGMAGQKQGIEGARRLRDLLQAAALGGTEARSGLAKGRLYAEPAPLGFGGLAPDAAAAPRPRGAGREPAARPADGPSPAEAAKLEKRAGQVVAARARARKAGEAAAAAEALATRLEAAADVAEEEARRLRREATAARRRAGDSRQRAVKAEADLK